MFPPNFTVDVDCRVLILGDSYVSRLATFLHNNNQRAQTEVVDPALHGNMGLPDCYLQLLGHERMTAKSLVQQYQQTGHNFVEKYQPDIVVVHLGGNDLYEDPLSPHKAEEAIFELIQILYFDFQVSQVVVCEIPPRKFPQRKAHHYMASLGKLNRQIQRLCYMLKGSMYCSYGGCFGGWNSEVFSKDGVNLESKTLARTLFCLGIRHAIVKAMETRKFSQVGPNWFQWVG